ncbi:MAG: FAD-dependent pyridine nucleotide-disulfide oxidoreductase [Gammaproteobacteria bacterium]|jgi:thioredoxin reductase|nr:FAD-dependent pyridine nucleotide-disulfide oxidoreductase [Gammaproteobacteria bacterium]
MRWPVKARDTWDVVIVGAGPAGLSAALVLGRACRQVLVCDNGTPRSRASKAIYAFVTRDGTPPAAFRRAAHQELRRYSNVARISAHVRRAKRLRDGRFEVQLGQRNVTCRKLLIATGVVDQLPQIAGIEKFFGTSVFQCPYCDGWEIRGAPVAVYGKARRGFEIARAMTAWTDDLALCTDGPAALSHSDKLTLRRNKIRLYEEPLTRLRGIKGKLQQIEFRDGSILPRTAMFFDTACTGRSQLAVSLGCEFNRRGGIRCGQYEATSVPGVFVAGNIIKDVQLSIVAAAEGARAAFGINRSLTREDFDRRASGVQRIEHPSMQPPLTQRRGRPQSPGA